VFVQYLYFSLVESAGTLCSCREIGKSSDLPNKRLSGTNKGGIRGFTVVWYDLSMNNYEINVTKNSATIFGTPARSRDILGSQS
jgi:hypothetical protein